MDYALIGKIEKAKTYAEERERISFNSFSVAINGENNSHVVGFDNGQWSCDCSFFDTRGYCSHTMAMERILDRMLPEFA